MEKNDKKENAEGIDRELLSILVCPKDKENLIYNENENKLICKNCRKEYRIKDNIPIFL